MSYVPLRKAVEKLGLHPHTLRKYADNGQIPSIRLPSGQRLFDIEAYLNDKDMQPGTICYCRVSSAKQKDDLDRQTAYMREQFKDAEIITDIGSGLNFKRKGLLSILERAMRGDKFKLVVAHRDRLARFGTELIGYVLQHNGCEIMVLDQTVHSPESELTKDLLSILHVFSCRMHGLRKYGNQIKKDKDLPHRSTTGNPS